MTLQQDISKTHQHGVAVAHQIARLLRLEHALERLNAARRKRLAAMAAARGGARQFTMYDSTEVGQIPVTAEAVAGYVGGNWPTFGPLSQKFGKAKRLSIAVNAGEDAECLDVETGDATPAEAPAWVNRQKARGVARPVLYANFSTMPAVKAALASAGIPRSAVRLWVAEYTYTPHIPSGYDACQYTNRALGRNLDASLCNPGFL